MPVDGRAGSSSNHASVDIAGRGVPKLGTRESLYLDLVRALAAFCVVLDHAPYTFDVPVPRWGHQAVIVFFVLSGYMISYTADYRDRTARLYLTARFARLWSVVVPAMALTIVCDAVGRIYGTRPDAYYNVPVDYPIIRIGAALAFLSESWVSIQPLSNGVVWSLCCEFWYYMLFAAWIFIPDRSWRMAVLVVTTIMAGHKAILLLPIWLFGVALQRSVGLRRLGPVANTVLWCTGAAVIAYVLISGSYAPAISAMRDIVSPWTFTQLAQSRVFWLDWILGLAVTSHLLGARTVSAHIPLERIATPIRWCAGISFSAYLFHVPLYHLWAAWLPRSSGWLAIALTLGVIAALGPPVERSKRLWYRAIEKTTSRIAGITRHLATVAPQPPRVG